MEKCRACRKETESTYSAYLQDRSKEAGFCRDCADKIEQEDLDRVVAECFERLCHVVNGGTPKELAASMFRTFVREHRHLQNQFFIALWFFFKEYGARELCDARNEWAVKIAKIWGDSTL